MNSQLTAGSSKHFPWLVLAGLALAGLATACAPSSDMDGRTGAAPAPPGSLPAGPSSGTVVAGQGVTDLAHMPLALSRGTFAAKPTMQRPPTATLTPFVDPFTATPTPSPEPATATAGPPSQTPPPLPPNGSRGYLTTPQELALIRQKADQGIEPYAGAVKLAIEWADKKWDTGGLKATVKCDGADKPKFIDEERGGPVIYAKALAYHLTGEAKYAEDVAAHLEKIMTEAKKIDLDADGSDGRQCELNFGWGTPELVAAADLIEDFWSDRRCTGPTSAVYGDEASGEGPCKALFQNWLVKNPYYVVSHTATARQSNWGAAGTNATAYIADYLWDRPEVRLTHRQPKEIDGGRDLVLSPAEAYAQANKMTLDRMNGYRLDYISDDSCDIFEGKGQSPAFTPVKGQITELGIIPEDARREEFCNIPHYELGRYENYPQVHLGNLIQQCELMLRRGDASCYENIDMTDLPSYTFPNPDPGPTAVSPTYTTHLFPGRGSVERAIDAIIVDAGAEWRHEAALDVAYRYYSQHSRFAHVDQWLPQVLASRPAGADQDISFGTLTHGFAPGEVPAPPPTVAPPR